MTQEPTTQRVDEDAETRTQINVFTISNSVSLDVIRSIFTSKCNKAVHQIVDECFNYLTMRMKHFMIAVVSKVLLW